MSVNPSHAKNLPLDKILVFTALVRSIVGRVFAGDMHLQIGRELGLSATEEEQAEDAIGKARDVAVASRLKLMEHRILKEGKRLLLPALKPKRSQRISLQVSGQ